MLSAFLQNQSAIYASGVMTSQEREDFELVLEFHDEVREFVSGLVEVGTSVFLSGASSSEVGLSAGFKDRLSARIDTLSQDSRQDGLAVTGPDGLVQWINPAFTAMCGYHLNELQGKKIGPILQGEKTDQATAERMRSAVHGFRRCKETIVNYHKNGVPYWVDIAITTIFNDDGEPIWMIAREHELSGRIV
jgi:PAS domain S-box-containing protein